MIERLAALLKKHQWVSSPYWWTGCSCDRLWWKGFENQGNGTEEMYRIHLATVLTQEFEISEIGELP